MLHSSRSTFSRVAFFLLAPLVGALPAAQAKTFTVQNLNDSGPGSLREAISAANSSAGSDLVDASTRTGTLKLASPLPLLQSQIVIKGSLKNPLIIQRNSRTPFNLFSIAKEASVSVQQLTLTGGGGGLETGGAISNEGTLSLSNCTLSGNSARRGGGVFSTGTLKIEGCTFSGNLASAGGAINSSNGLLTVSTSTFAGNSSTSDGGALILLQTRTALSRCTFTGNHTGRSGYGGAILAFGQFPLSQLGLAISNCTFAGNVARQGGALWTSAQATQLQNTTLCDNFALSGTGIWSVGDAATLTYVGGSILAGNANSPSVVGSDAESGSPSNTFVSLGYNLVGGGNGRSSFSKTGDVSGLSRQQLSLGSLRDNSGPTQTIAPTSVSPAVDAISLSALRIKIDQRGTTRAQGKGGDIGAVEVSSSPLVVNNPADTDDGACTATDCTLREAIGTANAAANGGATQTYNITFAPDVFSTPQVISLNPNGQGSANSLVTRGNINIVGPGASLLSVTSGSVSSRLLEVDGAARVQISGIGFHGGRPERGRGGAILNAGTLDLSGCILSGNRAEGGVGGAILNTGTLSLQACTVSGNSIRTFGLDSSGTGFNKTFGGGGIFNTGTLSVKGSTISGNSSSLNCRGGGLYNAGNVTLENSTVSDNSTQSKGGGIYSLSGSLTILSSTVSGNVASNGDYYAGPSTGTGGGIHSEGLLVLRNSTVAGNRVENDAQMSGGGVWVSGSASTIENCTITANDSNSYPAGGVLAHGGTTTISNSVIAANVNSAIYPDVLERGGDVVSGGYNFIGYSSYFFGPGDREGEYDTNGKLTVLDPHLGQLASNGGSVQTVALMSDSPLINRGNPNFDTSALPYDERGAGFPRVVGGRLDIGAFETQGKANTTSKANAAKGSSAGVS